MHNCDGLQSQLPTESRPGTHRQMRAHTHTHIFAAHISLRYNYTQCHQCCMFNHSLSLRYYLFCFHLQNSDQFHSGNWLHCIKRWVWSVCVPDVWAELCHEPLRWCFAEAFVLCCACEQVTHPSLPHCTTWARTTRMPTPWPSGRWARSSRTTTVIRCFPPWASEQNFHQMAGSRMSLPW